MSELNPPSDQILDAKKRLEVEKLELELKSLKRRPFFRIQVWQVISTSILGIASIILLFVNGAFDYKTKELSLKKENLEYDIRKFEAKRDSLTNSNKILLNASDSLAKLISTLDREKVELDKVVDQLKNREEISKSERGKLLLESLNLKRGIQKLKDSIDGIQRNFAQYLAGSRMAWEKGSTQAIGTLRNQLSGKENEIQRLNTTLFQCQGDLEGSRSESKYWRDKASIYQKETIALKDSLNKKTKGG